MQGGWTRLACNGKSPVLVHIHFGHYFPFWPSVKVLVKAPCGLCCIITHMSVWAQGFFLDLDLILGLARQATIGLEVLRGACGPRFSVGGGIPLFSLFIEVLLLLLIHLRSRGHVAPGS